MGGWKFWEKDSPQSNGGSPYGSAAARPNAEAQSTSEQTIYNDEIEGFGPRAASQRTINAYKVMGEGDMRRVISNINDLQGLDQRFAKEFDNAALHIQKRKSVEDTIPRKALAMVYEDLSKDKRYQYWQDEQAAMEKRLNIHWVDKGIDRTYTTLVWSLRLWTSLGMMMGIGRTAYLWRTMDKRYAKLHGVSLTSIASFEVSLHTMKGAAASFAAAFGVGFGDTIPHVVYALYYRDPVYRSREWYNVMASGTAFGGFGALVFSATNYRYFGAPGVKKATAAGALLGASVGWFIGKKVYDPFVSKLERRYDDPFWRPWYQRNMQREGNSRHQKGRLL